MFLLRTKCKGCPNVLPASLSLSVSTHQLTKTSRRACRHKWKYQNFLWICILSSLYGHIRMIIWTPPNCLNKLEWEFLRHHVHIVQHTNLWPLFMHSLQTILLNHKFKIVHHGTIFWGNICPLENIYRRLFPPGVIQPEHEADDSSSCSTEWANPFVFMTWYVSRGNILYFVLTLYFIKHITDS